MNYFIKRGEQEFGPYSLAVLQQYVAQGNISLQDLARSEGMTDWVPVSQVMGNVTVPTATTFGTSAPGGVASNLSLPPNLHWGLVVALGILTIGIFWAIWLIVQAVWIRKVRPQSRALYYIVAYFVLAFAGGFVQRGLPAMSALVRIASLVPLWIGVFGMRSDIEEYYATINPAGLSLSGVMTFFFNAAYFQYHLREIRQMSEASFAAAGGH